MLSWNFVCSVYGHCSLACTSFPPFRFLSSLDYIFFFVSFSSSSPFPCCIDLTNSSQEREESDFAWVSSAGERLFRCLGDATWVFCSALRDLCNRSIQSLSVGIFREFTYGNLASLRYRQNYSKESTDVWKVTEVQLSSWGGCIKWSPEDFLVGLGSTLSY